MTGDDRLAQLLRSALPPTRAPGPSRDLWPLVVHRMETPRRWSWLDVTLAVVVAIVLTIFPEWLSLLAYHL
jgi:hypothetical protein